MSPDTAKGFNCFSKKMFWTFPTAQAYGRQKGKTETEASLKNQRAGESQLKAQSVPRRCHSSKSVQVTTGVTKAPGRGLPEGRDEDQAYPQAGV
jgi:hypothetical protein